MTGRLANRREPRIQLKTEAQVDAMRKPCRLVARTLLELTAAIKPGVTTGELDRLAERIIRGAGGIPAFKGYPRNAKTPFPASVCTSVNAEVVHGIPGPRVLHAGDIISLDVGAIINGWHGDAATTVAVGAVTSQAEKLLEAGKAALAAGVAAARRGGYLGDVGAAIEETAGRFQFEVVREYVGHGIGRQLHEAPQVNNFGPARTGPQLQRGMTLAIEPMLNAGVAATHVLDDKWTVVTDDGGLSVHFEHTIVVHDEHGPEILTLAP